jgi:hypothetical protein
MLSDRAIRSSIERFQLAAPPSSASPASLRILLDASLSMTSGDGSKEQLARELAILLLRLSAAAGLDGSLCALRGRGRNRTIDAAEADRVVHIPFDSDTALVRSLDDESLGPAGADRVIISDFLWPDDPTPLVQAAASGVNRLWLVQLLDEWELNPHPAGRTVLHDVETEDMVELALDHSAIAEYSARLASLRDRIERCCKAVGDSLISVSAAVGLERLCADWLVPAGLLSVKVPVQ